MNEYWCRGCFNSFYAAMSLVKPKCEKCGKEVVRNLSREEKRHVLEFKKLYTIGR